MRPSKISAFLAGVALVIPPFVQAQLVSGRLVTSMYTWEKFDTVGSSKKFLRAFQTVQLSAGQGDVSLNTYLQGAVNGTNEFGDEGKVRLYNLYLRWQNIGGIADVNVGRQAVYAGAGNGTIDGVLAKLRFWQNRIALSGFGGATVRSDFGKIWTNVHDNYNIGAQVIVAPVSDVRVGISYMNRHEERTPYWVVRARDSSYAAVPYYIGNDSPAEKIGSADVYFTSVNGISVYGRYDYDFYLERTLRAQGGVRMAVADEVDLTADLIHREPRVMYNSIFSAFTLNPVTEFEAGAEYKICRGMQAFFRGGIVSYSGDDSHRWTLGLNSGYGSCSYTGSDGYAGVQQTINIQGVYPLLDNRVIPSAGVSYSSYRLNLDEVWQNAWAVVLGSTVRPLKTISVDLQGQLLTNKIMKQDFRLYARFSFWFAERLGLFGKEAAQ